MRIINLSVFLVGLFNSIKFQLPFVPRIGERISLDLGKYLVGCTSFYVCDVWHHIENGFQDISVYCNFNKEDVGKDGLEIWEESKYHVIELLEK